MTCKEKVLSEGFQDLLTYYLLPEGERQDGQNGEISCSIPVTDRLRSVYYDRRLLPPLSFADFKYRYVTELYGLMDDFVPEAADRRFQPQPLVKSGITAVMRPPLGLTGRNVTVGFVDTGIDYRNPVFRKKDGTTRILAIWDQTDQSGPPPQGLIYGTEYTREQINRALASENPLELVPVTDEIGHGTRMASAAVGSALNEGLDFLGAAPDADIVVVKMKQAKQYLRDYYMLPDGVPAYEANDIVLGVKYLDSFAVPLARPMVICLGVGRSFGDHVENSALSQYLSFVSTDVSRLVVVPGGNEGNSAHHYAGTLSANGRDEAELRVAEGTRGFLMEIWGQLPGLFSITIRSPGGEVIPPVSSRLDQSLEYTFVYDKTRIRIEYQPADPVTGSQVAVLRFEGPSPGIWTLTVQQEGGEEGDFHMWLPIRQFVEGSAAFLRPTPETTLTSPSYASAVLTVTAYDSRNDSFYINSGQGFGVNGRIKPELCAPGVNVSVAVGMLRGRTLVGTDTGTSMAAAITAGACAQLFQWAVEGERMRDINGVGIKNYLVRGAAKDAAYQYPSRQWGFGRLDMEGTFDWIAGILGRG